MFVELKSKIRDLVETDPKGYANTLRFKYPDLVQYLKMNYPSQGEGLFMWLNDITTPPMCKHCGTVPCKFKSIHNGGYREFCSLSCRAKYHKSFRNAHTPNGELKESVRVKNSQRAPESLKKRLTTYKAAHGHDMWENNTRLRVEKYINSFPEELKSYEFCSTTDRSWADLAEQFNVPYCMVRNAFRQHQIEPRNKGRQVSSAEIQLGELLDSLGVAYERSNRTVLAGRRELDIYIPSLNLAIEYCGLFWHSDRNNYPPNKHQEKFLECQQLGIKLITLFEDEWLLKRDIVESRIRSLVKQNQRVYARACAVETLPRAVATAKLNEWHIQGARNSSFNVSLTHHGQPVAVLTYGKPRYGKEDVEVIRYATVPGITVVGGFSRLLKRVADITGADTIVSYSDNRWGDGNVYKQSGMTKCSVTQPSYFYFMPKEYKRYHRSAFMKHKIVSQLGGDINLTEVENMRRFGYNRIFDCGTTKWVWGAAK